MDKLQVGDCASEFTLMNQDEQEVSLSQYRGKKVLIYFYPKALTPGCTTQSCAVRDAVNDIPEIKDVVALGISPDEPKKQRRFIEKHELNFQLLCDTEHKVAEAFAVWGEKSMYGKKYFGIIRSSFLIDEEGKLIGAWYKVKPKDTVPKALEVLQG